MTDADPAFWTGHAPFLFPIVGRLRGDSYRLNGREYSLPQPGFARRSMFRISAHDDASVLFRLNADEETQRVYPFDFRLDLAFAVEVVSLSMSATVMNPVSEVLTSFFRASFIAFLFHFFFILFFPLFFYKNL